MKIKIAERLRPFSLVPGASCVIPGTLSVLQAFPTLLRIDGKAIKLPLTGPVRGFTLQQDLEKHCVYVFGHAKEGYFRFRIFASEEGFLIEREKGKIQSERVAAEIRFVPKASFERLSLGSHKTQDWDQVLRRFDLKEILPVLFCLGQKIPFLPPQPLTGTATLLNWTKEDKLLAIESYLRASFRQMLVPRLIDDQHQGLSPEGEVTGDPFFLLQRGAEEIRALFFRQNERRLAFLPALPTAFDAGRMVGLKASGIGQIDLEWSKKKLRRAIIHANVAGDVVFELPKEVKTFRVNQKQKLNRDGTLLLEPNKTYYLDRFEK